MKILPLIILAAGLALTAQAETGPVPPSQRVLNLRHHFPAQNLARAVEFKECQACFERVENLASAEEAVRRAEDTKAGLIKALKAAEADRKQKADHKELAATIAWLNGPFTRYVERWHRLIEEMGKVTDVWRLAPPGETLTLISSFREKHQDWLDHHATLKDDLAKLEATAKVLVEAHNNREPRQVEEYHATFAVAKGRAEVIAKRETEKPESQDIARELADRLKGLDSRGEKFVHVPVRTVATGEALAIVRSVHETHQDWLDHHTGMKEDLARVEAKAKEIEHPAGPGASDQVDEFYFAIDASTDRAEDIAQREDEPAESRDFAQKLAARLAKVE